MKKISLFLIVWSLFPILAMAGVYELKPGLMVVFPEVSPPWKVTTEPSQELVEHLTEHILEDAKEKGQNPTNEQAREVALKRAKNNQLFVTNQSSDAHLLISFSPLKEGETAPSAKTVAKSAKYAAEGVTDEGWEVVSTRHAVTAIKGAQAAQWFAIDYTHEGEASLFMGIVGFADPYWFWLYGNDHLKDPQDKDYLEKLMLGIQLQVEAQ